MFGPVVAGRLVERLRLRRAGHDRYSDQAVDGPGRNDSMLRPFLDAPSHAAADPLLAELLEQHARPLLAQILRRKFASATTERRHDVDELAAEGVANILARLLDLRSGRNPEPIESFRNYVAVVAYNGWHRHLRERFPVRARLKNRLRYVLSRHPALTLWTDGGVPLCAVRRSQGNPVSASATRRLNDGVLHRDRFDREVFGAAGRPQDEAEVAAAIVAWVGGPVALDDVVAATGTLLGITDVAAARSTESGDKQEPAIQNVPDHARSALTAITEREDLARLWAEIQTLPVRQKCALLLNLRDDEGRGVIGLLPFTGTASIRQIADTLELPHTVLAGLWHELPLEDAVIAERLGLTRQQVINLRKSARARLARRTGTSSSCNVGR